MTKALFKKQMMEVFSWLYHDRKSGKNRSKTGTILFGAFYFVLIFGVLGSVFYFMSKMLCAPLMSAGLGWLYWSIMGMVTAALGVFGSVFNTSASLYQAKDNDLLLSMPVPVPQILAVRLMGVYLMGVIYELMVILPALIVWLKNGGSLWALQLPLVVSVLVLVLSCILGWVVALIASRVRNKNIVTVILSLVFIGGYYYIYGNAYNMISAMLVDPTATAEMIKGAAWPFYQMGLGAEGNVIAMLIFAAMVAVLFAVVCFFLARSFISIATANKGTKKAEYKEKTVKAASRDSALLRKELFRFKGSANYMLNCGLGIVIMIIAAAALVIFKNDVVKVMLEMFAGVDGMVPMLAAGAICMMATMCDMTAPSVSLEGKNIWLLQSLPVPPSRVLMAKLKMHIVLTLPPALILTAAVLWVVRPEWYFCILIPAVVLVFVLFTALMGLLANLKLPNLNWTSEIVPIKQGASAAIALFGGWAVVLLLGGAYVLLAAFIKPVIYLAMAFLLLLVLSAFMFRWIRTKGALIFETL